MTDPFQAADRIFDNARRFTVAREALSTPPEIRGIIRGVRATFAALANQEDEHDLRRLRRSLKTFAMTVSGCALPFEDPTLELERQTAALTERSAPYGSVVSDLIRAVAAHARALREVRPNPKQQALEQALFSGQESIHSVVGLIFPTREVPGWDANLLQRFSLGKTVVIKPLLSRKSLQDSEFDSVVSIWPLYNTGYAEELVFSFRWPLLRLILYRHENASLPESPHLPALHVSAGSPRLAMQVTSSGEPDLDLETDWLEPVAPVGGAPVVAPSDRQHLVSARYVALATGQRVALQEDRAVIEVSALLDGSSEDSQGRLPRVKASALGPGDLIVIRTGGSGDYMLDVADGLMAKSNRRDLRVKALFWKSSLADALRVHGSEAVGEMLATRGFRLANHRYIWTWTTRDVIRPASADLFYGLLGVLADLGFLGRAAAERGPAIWRLMWELIRYHVQAGQAIRRALLSRLRQLINERVVVRASLVLELPGVDAGELSVFRVEQVARSATLVPYSEIGIVRG